MKPVSARFPGQRDQSVEPDPLLDLGTLDRRPLVVPEDRRPDDAAGGVQSNEAVHLTGEADTGDMEPTEIPDRGECPVPPVVGILLRPAGSRGREWIAALGPREHRAVRGDGDRLDAGRADVETEERGGSVRSHGGDAVRGGALALDDVLRRMARTRSAASTTKARTPSS